MTLETIGKVFLLESPNALDLAKDIGERSALEQICKLFGHDVSSFFLRDEAEFNQTLAYISGLVYLEEPGDSPLFIHISSHGNADGIAIGADHILWKNLAEIIAKTYQNLDKYDGPIVFIISACGANEQKISRHLSGKKKKGDIAHPPEYIFVFSDEEVAWRDAVVTWTIFYRRLGLLDFMGISETSNQEIRDFLKVIKSAGLGTLSYSRWDRKETVTKNFLPRFFVKLFAFQLCSGNSDNIRPKRPWFTPIPTFRSVIRGPQFPPTLDNGRRELFPCLGTTATTPTPSATA